MTKHLHLKFLLLVFFLCSLSGSLLAQTDILMGDPSPIIVQTGDIFYDSGGSGGDYDDYEDYTITFTVPVGFVIKIVFDQFNLENHGSCRYDWLKAFDGNSVSSDSFGTYCGTNTPGSIISTGRYLTFQFQSDVSVVRSGWKATIKVLDPTSPTVADCLGAKTICNSFYDEPSPEIEGQGNVTNELPIGDCIPDEKNGIWYAFSPQNDIDAELKFSITPSNSRDDYDWVIFDVTDVRCEDLSSIDISTSDVFISGNTYGANKDNETGADSDQGSGNCNGPGTSNGPKWNADIPVKPNRNYVLYVSNWSESNRGYTINFNEGGTAIIYDDVLPDLDGVVQACYGEDKLKVEFSEIIPCGSLNKNDITVQIGGVAYGVADISSSNCDLGGVGSNSYIIFLDEIIADSGLAEIKITAAGIMDMCGNVNDEESTLTFTVSELTASLSVDKNPACVGEDVVIKSSAIGGIGAYTYEFYLNDNPLVSDSQYSITGNELSSNVFNDGDVVKVKVTDQNGCSAVSLGTSMVSKDTAPIVPILADVTGECTATAIVPTTTDDCSGTIMGTTSDPLTYTTQGTHTITWTFDDGLGDGSVSNPFKRLGAARTVTTNGRYYFDLGNGVFQADVDNSEGGGWVLILQYHHAGGTNPVTSVIGTGSDLPVESNSSLGTDLSGTSSWGHAGNAALSDMAGAEELRWYAQTSAHTRLIHFKSSVGLTYAQSGAGSFNGIESAYTLLTGHTANLPAAARNEYADKGNEALTSFPMWLGGTYHWGIRGNGNRWEVDDYPNGSANSTIHKMWVRGSLVPVGNVVTATQKVIVKDVTSPIISDCPLDITQSVDSDQCDALVNWTEPTATDNCTVLSSLVWTQSHISGSTFSVGTTNVTYTVEDESGNNSECSFDVIVSDNEDPQISCQADIAHVLYCDRSIVNVGVPNPTDNCTLQSLTYRIGSGSESGDLLASSGSTISINLPAAGDHIISWTAADVNGNASTCDFTIHVDAKPVINAVSAVSTTCATGDDGQIVVSEIAVESGTIEYSIDGANWQASNIFTGLSAGNYDVKIRTKIGVGYCESASKSVSVDNPTAITINQSNLIDATCSANTDGEININVSGGDQVMSFDGTDSYIALDLNYNSTTAIPEMTVAAWVKVGPASGGGGWSILDFDRSEYFNFTIGGINASDVYHVSFNTRSLSGNIHDFNSLSTIGDDQWHFVVGVYNSTGKYIYIDGVLDNSISPVHSGIALGSTNARYAFIGTGSEASTFDGAKNGGRIFDGNIADVWYFESSITSTDELNGLSQGTIPGGYTARGHWRLNDISNGFISNLANSDSYGQVFGMDASNITAANLYTFSCTKDGTSFSLDGNISEESSNNYKLSNLAVGDYVLTVIDHKGCAKNTLFTIGNGDISLPVIIGLNDVNMCALDALTQKAIVSGIALPDANYSDNCGGVLTVKYQIKDKDDAVLVDFGVDSDGDASGFEFPEGVNTVTYEVTDAVGLSSEMSFKVTIEKKPNPIGIFGE
ncbi:MAG: HYR domain-containing protein [Labilibaculum antarcticum]